MKVLHLLYLLLAFLFAGLYLLLPQVLKHEDRVEEKISVLFVGDMMFDRTIRNMGEKNGYDSLFSCIDPYLKSFDLVIGNLEGTITSTSSKSVGTKPGDLGNTAFTFSTTTAKLLSSHNIGVVNVGNNHILDFGLGGVESTRNILEEGGVIYFGAPGHHVSTTTMVKSREIGLVNFNQFLGENNPNRTIKSIKDLKAKKLPVIVYTHWGDEYLPETDMEKSVAHSFIDAGADLIIGSHPHVIQSIETYKGKKIYYSLGNFIFDQYWSPEVSTGMGVELNIQGDDFYTREQVFRITRSDSTCIMQVDGR